MTPTSEERREVAERMRKSVGISEFVRSVGIDPDGNDWLWKDVAARVADLIDPTCEYVVTDVEYSPHGRTIYHHELSCGHVCDTVWPDPPAHCCECGARVVASDEMD